MTLRDNARRSGQGESSSPVLGGFGASSTLHLHPTFAFSHLQNKIAMYKSRAVLAHALRQGLAVRG